MRSPSAALILIVSLLITGLAVAEPFEDATKAYNRGDYETTYHIIKPAVYGGLERDNRGEDSGATESLYRARRGRLMPRLPDLQRLLSELNSRLDYCVSFA